MYTIKISIPTIYFLEEKEEKKKSHYPTFQPYPQKDPTKQITFVFI